MPADLVPTNFVLDCRGLELDCRPGQPHGAHVMGILNVTPDSFSDGGLFLKKDDALRRAEQMLEEGARLIDVGGESSRPAGSAYGEGAEAVAADEERQRVVPVVEALVQRFPEAIVSVDTYKPEVARAVLEAGAHVINDVTGLRYHPETAEIAAEAGAPMVVMHALGRPGEMPQEHHYDDVVQDVHASLQASVERAVGAGVQHVVTDPGFGFGKTPQENLRLLRRVDVFLGLQRPVLVGLSRKSTIGSVLGALHAHQNPRGDRSTGRKAEPAKSFDRDPTAPVPVEERLFGTLGATSVAVLAGASMVRTHDVRPTVEMLRLLGATANA